jgi:hypothetical protein
MVTKRRPPAVPVLFLLLLLYLLACNSAGPTAPDSWPRVATKHGTVTLQPGVNPVLAVRYIEAGFSRARTRTTDPAGRVDRHTVEGVTITLGTWSRYLGGTIEILEGAEFSLEHETQHLLADRNGIKGPCQQYQDHANDNPWGGCDLDGRWAR